MSDHAKAPRWTRRLRKSPHFLTAAVLIAVAVPVSFAGSASAVAGSFAGFSITTDTAAHDANTQVDLTQMGNDPTHSPYRLFWSWSDTTWTGKNTGDACALLDANGDGKVDQSVCGEVGAGPGGTVVQTITPILFDCDNKWIDRCGQPSQNVVVPSGGVIGSDIGAGLDANGNLITNSDPFVAGGPNSTLEIDIAKAGLLGAATLLNVCSYPSAGNGGNTNPFDCVVDLGSHLSLTKDASSNPATVGSPVTYTLTATNDGISKLTGVSITDTGFAPAPTLTCTVNGAAATPPVTLNIGEALVCTFDHTFGAAFAGTNFTNTATAGGTDAARKAVSATASKTIAIIAAPTATVKVTKTVTGPLPQGTGKFDINVTCDDGTNDTSHYASGDSHNVTGIADAAKCSVTETGAQSANSTSYTFDDGSGAGAVAYTAGHQFTVAKNNVYTVAVTNHYNGATIHVTKSVTGTPPAGLGNFDVNVTCNDGTNTTVHVAAGGSADVTGIAGNSTCTAAETGAQGATSTTYTLDGAAYTAGGNISVVNNQTRTVAVTNDYAVVIIPPPPPPVLTPNLTLAKSSVPAAGGTVKPGDTVTYTLSYANTGTGVANTVVTSDPLPAGLTFTSAANGGTYDAATNTVSWPLNNVAAGANGTLSFVATVASTVTQGQSITNVGSIAAAGVNPVQSNPDTVTVDIPVTPPTPTLTVVKQVDSTVAEYGDTLTYTLAVTAGGADQTGVIATDKVPDGTAYVAGSATCSTGCTGSEAAGVVTWSIGNMAAGDTTTVTFKATISSPAPAANGGIPPETVTNVGTAKSDTVDPADSNQVKTQVVAVLGISKKPPATKPTPKPEPSPLPFTGLPFPLLQTLVLSALMIVAGLWLTRPRRRRPLA
jgi:uncharacterized repeat protein (TIGR01451 family)